MCMIIGTLGTAIAGQAYHIDMFAVIMFWRVFGGEANVTSMEQQSLTVVC